MVYNRSVREKETETGSGGGDGGQKEHRAAFGGHLLLYEARDTCACPTGQISSSHDESSPVGIPGGGDLSTESCEKYTCPGPGAKGT